MTSWIDQELAGCEFRDKRLKARFRKILNKLSDGIGRSIPLACRDWASTKAAYRFFANPRVKESEILGGHFQATAERLNATKGPVLVLQDTTEFSYKREDPQKLGLTRKSQVKRWEHRRPKIVPVCGILMHSSLAVTTEGLPLGLMAAKIWTRKKFKGSKSLARKINPTRVPIEEKESYRWVQNMRESTALADDPSRIVHVGDRESDIYELYCEAAKLTTHFLVRIQTDRLAGDGSRKTSAEMKAVQVKGLHRIEVQDDKGKISQAVLEIKYARVLVKPPIGKQKRYPDLELTIIYAQECGQPKGRKKIEWKIITNLPVRSRREAIEKLDWYALRWKIETFHKILKSGCRAEELKLRTADRLANLVAIFCVLSWRVFWMTMVKRTHPKAKAGTAFTSLEMRLLDRLVPTSRKIRNGKTLSEYMTKLARLGGYLARANDGPPGNTVIWRGLSRLTDIELGYELAQNCG
jgi:Transposase DNA-binding/Transposase DDE domain